MKLNIGCGRNQIKGFVNVDCMGLPGVDIVCKVGIEKLPLEDNIADEIFCSHTLEHIEKPLPFMQELWRVAKPGCLLTIRVPYGSTDVAFEDPTHIRQYFPGSFQYFGQPAYMKADYGYRGDWDLKEIQLRMPDCEFEGKDINNILLVINRNRNIVEEMTASLECVKPLRVPQDLPFNYKLVICFPEKK